MSTDTKLKDVLDPEPEKATEGAVAKAEEKKDDAKAEPKKESAKKSEVKKEEAKKAEPKKEEAKKEEAKKSQPEKTETAQAGQKIYYSDAIKIYSAPSLHSAAVIFQGVIEICSKPDQSGFTRLSYVSPAGILTTGYAILSRGEK